MNSDPTPDRPPLSDSPWFWAYLFATAALVAVFLAGPKYVQRQPQLERQFSARQQTGQTVSGPDGAVRLSTPERLIISLRPLYVVLGLLLVAAWVGLWYQRYRNPLRGQRSRDR